MFTSKYKIMLIVLFCASNHNLSSFIKNDFYRILKMIWKVLMAFEILDSDVIFATWVMLTLYISVGVK